MKKISVRNWAAIKRVAQNVNPLVVKRNKAEEKIEALKKEITDLQMEIECNEAGVKAITGGYCSEDLVNKVVEITDKVNAKGEPVKVTKYVPTDRVEYNEEDKCYYIKDEELNDVNPLEVDSEAVAPEVETTDWMKDTVQFTDEDAEMPL